MASPPVGATSPVYGFGDVFASVGSGQVKEFTPTGTLVRTLDDGQGGAENTGSAFDSSDNLLVTTFSSGTIDKFDSQGNYVGVWANPGSDGFGGEPESISLDQAGNAFVGAADTSVIREYNSSGTLINHFTVATEDRGTDWVDLASDQCTLHYTSEGSSVLTYNVCTNTQEAPFATGMPGEAAYELREIPGSGGEILVADSSAALLLSSSGAILRTYTPTGGATSIFALNLDPDGTSFWTADLSTGQIYRFRISDGTQLETFNASPVIDVAGLSVFGERTSGVNNPPVVDAGPPESGPVNTPIALQGSVSDAEGDPLTILWTVPSGTPCTFLDPTSPTTSIECNAPGSYTATLSANDGTNPTVTDSTEVVIGSGTGGPQCSFSSPTVKAGGLDLLSCSGFKPHAHLKIFDNGRERDILIANASGGLFDNIRFPRSMLGDHVFTVRGRVPGGNIVNATANVTVTRHH